MNKKSLSLLAMLGGSMAVSMAQTVSGKLTDEQNQPLPFANVVLLALPDSTFVTGTMSNENGNFSLKPASGSSVLRISSVGYTTLYRPVVGDAVLGTLQMQPDAQLLGEVVVKADLPKMRLKGDAVVTTVAGSVLEKAGTGEDLLGKLPGVSVEEGKVNVFGAGTPEIYINGRKVRDASELDQLSSDNVQTVEVVNNPGARYDATVNAVIRIRTKKPQGEGFGFDNRLYTYHHYGWTVLDQFNFNYRKGGFDLSGMLYGSDGHNEDNKFIRQQTFLDKTWTQESELHSSCHSQNVSGMLALNYQFNENHSLGARYDVDHDPTHKWTVNPIDTRVYQDDALYEESHNTGWTDRQYTNHALNMYYNGQVGNWNIDFNADGFWGDSDIPQQMREEITRPGAEKEVQTVTTRSGNENTLYAGKLIVSRPLWGGNFSLGGEYTYTDRGNSYVNVEGILDNDDSKIRENSAAAFLEYGHNFGPLQAQVGVRYEHLSSDYYEQGQYIDAQSRTYDNVFPSVSLSLPVGKAQLQLSYTGSIYRPTYYMLRSDVLYVNRYTYEAGNPLLQPSLINRLSFLASYKWLSLNARYIHGRDAIVNLSSPYSEDNPTISVLSFYNKYDSDKLYATLTLAPSIGIWSPQLTLMLLQQWYRVDTPEGQVNFNNPMGNFFWSNNFRLPAGFSLDIDFGLDTPGHNENYRIEETAWTMNLGLYKSFFDERLSLQLQAKDLFNSNKTAATLYSGNRLMYFDGEVSRTIGLTVRYKFNTSKSKYKGTGAGQEQRNRM